MVVVAPEVGGLQEDLETGGRHHLQADLEIGELHQGDTEADPDLQVALVPSGAGQGHLDITDKVTATVVEMTDEDLPHIALWDITDLQVLHLDTEIRMIRKQPDIHLQDLVIQGQEDCHPCLHHLHLLLAENTILLMVETGEGHLILETGIRILFMQEAGLLK